MIEIVNIPKGTRFISQYPEISKYINKPFPILINKVLTGCGFSSYYLNKQVNNENVVLCSPRRFMIFSKVYDSKFSSYLIEWRPETMKRVSIEKLKERLKMKIESNLVLNEPSKIITTWDSFKYVKEVLKEMDLLEDFRIIVDEQQDIIKDSAFKGCTVKNYLKELEGINKIVYLSATPTPKEFNDKIPILKDIYTIVLNWCKDDLRKINFQLKPLKKDETFTDILRKYKEKFDKDGYFSKKVVKGKTYYSREICVFVSNIELIIHIIKLLKLTNENTDVICSEGDKTSKKLYEKTRVIGLRKSGFKPSKPKKLGEDLKPFTFITRCSYEGADFYSTNASTIILSNPSIDCMSIDIGIDLNQIIGRQRLENNVFRDDITLYTQIKGEFTSFEQMRETKLSSSNEFLEFWKNSKNKDQFLKMLKMDYSADYLEINEDTNILQVSEMRMLAEDYAESVRQDQFNGDKYIFKTFNEADYNNNLNDDELKKLNQFYTNFNLAFSFSDKLRFLCEFLDLYPNFNQLIQNNSHIPSDYINYYNILGSKVIKAAKYRQDNIDNKIKIINAENEIRNIIFSSFKVGDILEVSKAKELLNQIYKNLNLKKKAKSTDLNQYYYLTEFKKRVNNKVVRYIRIDNFKPINIE